MAAFVCCAALLTYTRGKTRMVSRYAVCVIALAWLLFYLVEASVLVTTGLAGSYFMLQDFLARPVEVLPLIKSEFEWYYAVIGGVPIAVVAGAPYVARSRSRVALRVVSAPSCYGMGRAVWAAIPFALLLTFLPSRSTVPVEMSVSRFIQTASQTIDTQELVLSARTSGGFDTRELRTIATDSTRKKNVVVIVMESVRSRSTGLYDSDLDTTPFLDSLAQHSALVEQFYVPVSYTNKSLVSLFGGIYPSPQGHVLEGEAVPGGIPARGLPSLLAEHGYRSAFFTPATMEYERKDVILGNLGFGEVYGDKSFSKEGFTQKGYFGYEDHVALDATLNWAEQAGASGDPFLLGLLTLTSHHPYDTPDSFETRSYHTGDVTLEAYLNAIRYTDGFIRDLMAGFEKRGLLGSTVFVIVGDHGEAFGEHTVRIHGDVMWDEALHVPALIYAPGVVPPGRITGARHSIDLVPTVLDVLNLEPAGSALLGASLLQPVPAGRTLFHACRNARAGLAVRKDTLKYVYWIRKPTQVFNTALDPQERFDIAAELPKEQIRRVESEARTWYFYNEQAYGAARLDAAFEKEARLAWRSENQARYEQSASRYWVDK